MALSIAPVKGGDEVLGRRKMILAVLTPDASYSAGGYAITAAQVGLKEIEGVLNLATDTSGLALRAVYDFEAKKLAIFDENSEAAGDLSAHRLRVAFVGWS